MPISKAGGPRKATPYQYGYAAERTAIRDLEQLGLDARRSAASHGPWDCCGIGPQPPKVPLPANMKPLIPAPVTVLVQSKRGKDRPSPCEYRTLVEMVVPEGTIKVVLFYPEGLAAATGNAARVLWCNVDPLPEWFGFVRWLDDRKLPRQPKIRTL